MANYECAIRTNHFHVKNEEEFRAFMNRVYGSDEIEVFEKKDREGRPIFAFGSYGGISGVKNAQDDECDDSDESAYDEFIRGLQECIADNDAVIILEAGHEKLRQVYGVAEIITSCGYNRIDITNLAMSKAGEMLSIPNWGTQFNG